MACVTFFLYFCNRKIVNNLNQILNETKQKTLVPNVEFVKLK